MNLTAEQKQAIFHDKGNILISASAGSGKTFVMIQRLIRLILEGKAEVKNILAVTFTNLAAAEMKEKLIKAITQVINSPDTEPDKAEALKAQLADVPSASISTFHSFCNDLIKNYFYELGIDASFKIADEVQSKMLKIKATDKLFEEKYSSGDEEFKYLLSLFLRGRNDVFLRKLVHEVFAFFETEAYPELEAKRVVDSYSEEGYQKIKTAFFAYYQDVFTKIADELQSLKQELISAECNKQADAANVLLGFCSWLTSSKDFFELSSNCRGIDIRLPIFKTNGDEYLEGLKSSLSALKNRLTHEAKYLTEAFGDRDEPSVKADLLSMRRAVESIVNLCFEFGREYASLKREENVVDFSDLEHFTLALLDKEDIRLAVRNKYAYIFADEYQDTNGVQEEILNRISQDNLFMVGDVKQSIYAFRGCNPAIFERKFTRFLQGEGTALSLTSNFRSSASVLNTVNGIFSEVMTVETCGIDYKSNLMTGGNGEVGNCSVHLAKKKDGEVPPEDTTPAKPAKKRVYSVKENLLGNDDTDVFNEGVMIASVIREALAEPVTLSDGTTRPLEYKDIVILSRSMGNYTRRLADTLADNDVPVSSEAKKDVTVFPETRSLIALLRLVDCARQDVALCAVMRGPVGGFTDAELAEIRSFSTRNSEDFDNRNFCSAVDFYLEKGEGALKQKLEGFFAYVERLRFLSDFESAGELLARVVREKDLDLYYMATRNGKNRLKRINKLISEASASETPYSVREFLARIDADADDISVTDAGNDDAVRLMSIHSSKGLEFPVVIVCGLDRQFNVTDVADEIIKDREFGISLKTYDTSSMKVRSNILREFLKKRYRSSFVKEEMRILYVALTRAKSRLYLTQTGNSLPERVTVLDVMGATSYSKLISSGKAEVFEHTPSQLKLKCVEKRERSILAAQSDSAIEGAIKSNLSFVYPYAVNVAAKSSVTAILKDGDTSSASPVLFEEYSGANLVERTAAIERGNAYHRMMELLDFQKPSLSQITEQKQSFVQNGLMTATEAGIIEDGKIAALLADCRFRIDGAEYYRELPFEVLVPSNLVGGDCSEDEVLVQGVIDLIIFSPGGIMIVDYKVSFKSAEALKADYRRQLELYAYAAERITGQKVVSKTLMNLQRGELVEV